MSDEHPGKAIARELAARDWLQAELAWVLGTSPGAISAIICGRRGVSCAMSKRLGAALGFPERHFADMQFAYDLSRAKPPSAHIAQRRAEIELRAAP